MSETCSPHHCSKIVTLLMLTIALTSIAHANVSMTQTGFGNSPLSTSAFMMASTSLQAEIAAIDAEIEARKQNLRQSRRVLVKSLIQARKSVRSKRAELDKVKTGLSEIKAKRLFASGDELKQLEKRQKSLLNKQATAEVELTEAMFKVDELEKRFQSVDFKNDSQLIKLMDARERLAAKKPTLPVTQKRNTSIRSRPRQQHSQSASPRTPHRNTNHRRGSTRKKLHPTFIALYDSQFDADTEQALKSLLESNNIDYLSLAWKDFLQEADGPDEAYQRLLEKLLDDFRSASKVPSPLILLGFEEGAAIAIQLSHSFKKELNIDTRYLITADTQPIHFERIGEEESTRSYFIGDHINSLLNVWQTTYASLLSKPDQSQAIQRLAADTKVDANQQRLIFNELHEDNIPRLLSHYLPDIIKATYKIEVPTSSEDTGNKNADINEQSALYLGGEQDLNDKQVSRANIQTAVEQIFQNSTNGHLHLKGRTFVNRCIADLYYTGETLFFSLSVPSKYFHQAFYILHPKEVFQMPLGSSMDIFFNRTIDQSEKRLMGLGKKRLRTLSMNELEITYSQGHLNLTIEKQEFENERNGKLRIDIASGEREAPTCKFDLKEGLFTPEVLE